MCLTRLETWKRSMPHGRSFVSSDSPSHLLTQQRLCKLLLSLIPQSQQQDERVYNNRSRSSAILAILQRLDREEVQESNPRTAPPSRIYTRCTRPFRPSTPACTIKQPTFITYQAPSTQIGNKQPTNLTANAPKQPTKNVLHRLPPHHDRQRLHPPSNHLRQVSCRPPSPTLSLNPLSIHSTYFHN